MLMYNSTSAEEPLNATAAVVQAVTSTIAAVMQRNTERPSVQIASLQHHSDGVEFNADTDDYKFCTFSEGGVEGRDEKYIFPCAAQLDCCGRRCCDPVPEYLPWWMWLLFFLLLLLLLLICCSICAWIWYKCRPKKEKPQQTYAYLDAVDKVSTAPPSDDGGDDEIRRMRALAVIEGERQAKRDSKLRTLSRQGTLNTTAGSRHGLDAARIAEESGEDDGFIERKARGRGSGRSKGSKNGNNVDHRVTQSHRQECTVDEPNDEVTRTNTQNMEENYTEEKFVPSPMQETFVQSAKPITVQRHSGDEISREQRGLLVTQDNPDTQRAQIAFYRPFVPSPMEELVVQRADKHKIHYHDPNEISVGQKIQYATLDRPKASSVETAFNRPGFDNVPSY